MLTPFVQQFDASTATSASAQQKPVKLVYASFESVEQMLVSDLDAALAETRLNIDESFDVRVHFTDGVEMSWMRQADDQPEQQS